MKLLKQKANPRTDQFRSYASYRMPPPNRAPSRKKWRPWLGIVVVLLIGSLLYAVIQNQKDSNGALMNNTLHIKPNQMVAQSHCSQNTLDKFISVSISQRHMWVCEQTKQVYDSPVITGMQNLAADLTPPGTYKIYAKQTNLTLRGSDSTGSWNDPVSYWMPFLSNQYGVYGFHDATWRPGSEFGTIDPYSNKGSHGCVELPLATSAWLYSWSSIGTTLTISS